LLPEEKKAIKHLISMGFRKKDAKEAYFVCDKNEELAASYLYNRLERG
jgi:UV excision repair protein RAD23